MFDAWKLEFGEFLDRGRGLHFCGWGGECRLIGLYLGRPSQARFFRRSGAWWRGALGLPDLVGIDLRLTKAGKIVGDGVFGVEPEMLGVGANESFVEDATGELVEVLLFDGLEHARADLGDVGNVIEREFLLLARHAEFVAELAHRDPVWTKVLSSQ